MPNGDPRFDLNELEEFFAPFEEVLVRFADTHNLLIEKYYHESPSWSLCFNHPKGGQAKISLVRGKEDTATISSTRWRDDHESFSRSLKWGVERPCSTSPEEIYATLEQELDEVLCWAENDWSEVVTDYKNTWGRYTKAQFERMTPDWPLPRVEG